MLKLTKYELRKNISGVLVMLCIVLGLQIYFVASAVMENRNHTAISTVLLVVAAMVAYFAMFFLGISTYSKELKSKTGYMTFMAPVSSYAIIGSKLLAIFITGAFFIILFGTFACIDMAMFEKVFPETELFTGFVDTLLYSIGYETGDFLFSILEVSLEILISFYAIVSIAYMSITLSSTAFQNKKYKGVVSAVIFVILIYVIEKVAELLPALSESVSSLGQSLIAVIPALIYYFAIIVICVFASGKLLDKRVSL